MIAAILLGAILGSELALGAALFWLDNRREQQAQAPAQTGGAA